MAQRFVLVTGATGGQGGAVTEALLAKGHRVRALTRKLDGAPAAGLRSNGVEVVAGSFDDPQSLKAAATGVDAIFALSTPFEGGPEVEIAQGKALADAAQAARVAHLVYASVSDADCATGVPHFDSKYEVEKYIQTLDVPWTVVAPAYFFDNALFPWNVAALGEGRYRQPLPAGRALQQISKADIGRFSALVIEKREPFLRQRINIAGDEVTGHDAATALSKAIGRRIEYVEQPMAEVRAQSEDLARMYEWFDRVGYSADIGALRRDHPEVGWTSFEDWATAQDWQGILAAAA